MGTLRWDPETMGMIDIGAGIGGFSLGAKEAGFHVVGMEIDPISYSIYRSRVGPCWQGSILSPSAHPPSPARLVVSDLPVLSSIRRGTATALPKEHILHSLRIAIEANADAVLFIWIPGNIKEFTDGRHEELTYMEKTCAEAGYIHTKAIVSDAVNFGVPQYRSRLLVAGFRYKYVAEAFRWPKYTTRNPVTVKDVLGIAYPFPSPTVTSSENKSGRKGVKGGTSPPRRASEIISEVVGRGAWEGPVAMSPSSLAALQGLPSWDWSALTKLNATSRIGRAFPPPWAAAISRSFREALLRRKKLVRPRNL